MHPVRQHSELLLAMNKEPLDPEEVRAWMKRIEDNTYNQQIWYIFILLFLALNSVAYWLNR